MGKLFQICGMVTLNEFVVEMKSFRKNIILDSEAFVTEIDETVKK